MKYICVAKDRQLLPWAHIEADPGQEIETDKDLSTNPNFVPMKPARPAKEA